MTQNTNVVSDQAAHDGYVAAHKKPGNPETGTNKPVSRDEKGEPNNMDEDVTPTSSQELLTCPQCGKPTLRVEFPDQIPDKRLESYSIRDRDALFHSLPDRPTLIPPHHAERRVARSTNFLKLLNFHPGMGDRAKKKKFTARPARRLHQRQPSHS